MEVKLGNLTKIRTGKLDANASSENGQYPFFTCSREPLKISTYSYDCECVLVAGNGDLNVKYYNGRFDAYQRTYIIEDNGSGKLYMPYLYYFMEGYIGELRKQAIGGVIKYIKLGNLTDALIKLPSIDEQKAIVDILARARHILNIRKEEIDNLDNLIKARFVEMFGNILCDSNLPVIQLKKLADIGSSKRIYANEYVESGVPFYRSKEIRELGTGMKPSVELFIKQERYDEIKEKYGVPKVGDILIAAIGATIGYSWIVDSENPFYYKDGNIIILSIKDNVNPIFLNHTMRILIDDFKNKGVAGSAQLALTIEKLEKMMVINPPIELQNRFADFVRAIDKSKVKVQKALDETQKLFDSLMQQYFG